MGRAAIYVRTSSEHQAEKSSPEEQERDCRQLAEREGLEVVAVFRDITRYRVKGKLVDPSGTRADRPGLVAMMTAAAAGEFSTIIAWKEDRLYRGLKAMLYVLEGIQEHRLHVLLAMETFDEKIAPLKAWVAGMELDSLKERMAMGVKARLREGKANTGQDRYGYRREGARIVVVVEEAKWVRAIFSWYNDRVFIPEIRRRLIEAGAPQKGSSVPRKIVWARTSIQSILQAAPAYAMGVKRMTRGGEVYELPVEPLISMATYERYLEVRAGKKTWPAHNVKRDYLVRGLVYCGCGRRWGARMTSYRAKGVKRKTPIGAYFCTQAHEEMRDPDCPRSIGSNKADDYVWERVVAVLDEPDVLLVGARAYVERLRMGAEKMRADRQRLEAELELMTEERQWVITQARKGRITEADMEEQLAAITLQEGYLRRQLGGLGAAEDLAGTGEWEEVTRAYLADLREGLAELEEEPRTEEEQRAHFELRRQAVMALVERVDMSGGKKRKMTVTFRLDILSVLGRREAAGGGDTTSLQWYLVEGAGTYSRKHEKIQLFEGEERLKVV